MPSRLVPEELIAGRVVGGSWILSGVAFRLLRSAHTVSRSNIHHTEGEYLLENTLLGSDLL